MRKLIKITRKYNGFSGDAHVIAHVLLWRLVHRREPYNVDTQPLNVVELRSNPFQIADAIPITIAKRRRIYLVHDGGFPPRFVAYLGDWEHIELSLRPSVFK